MTVVSATVTMECANAEMDGKVPPVLAVTAALTLPTEVDKPVLNAALSAHTVTASVVDLNVVTATATLEHADVSTDGVEAPAATVTVVLALPPTTEVAQLVADTFLAVLPLGVLEYLLVLPCLPDQQSLPDQRTSQDLRLLVLLTVLLFVATALKPTSRPHSPSTRLPTSL